MSTEQGSKDASNALEDFGPWHPEHPDYPANREAAAREKYDGCMCDTVEEGWRPCPPLLCERSDHDHQAERAGQPWLRTHDGRDLETGGVDGHVRREDD